LRREWFFQNKRHSYGKKEFTLKKLSFGGGPPQKRVHILVSSSKCIVAAELMLLYVVGCVVENILIDGILALLLLLCKVK
jgi:hypothetical protein